MVSGEQPGTRPESSRTRSCCTVSRRGRREDWRQGALLEATVMVWLEKVMAISHLRRDEEQEIKMNRTIPDLKEQTQQGVKANTAKTKLQSPLRELQERHGSRVRFSMTGPTSPMSSLPPHVTATVPFIPP